MKKRIIAAMIAAVMIVSLVGCGKKGNSESGSEKTVSADGTYTLKIGNTVADKDPFNVAYAEFEKSVEEASNGKIQVEVLSNGAVAETDTDVLDKVRANTLQMGNTTPNCFAALANMPAYYVYGIPYLMSTDEELNTVGESDWISGLNDDFQKSTGVKVFPGGGVNMGWFGFSSTKKKVENLADLKGMSIRINQTNQMIALAEGASINPQFIAFSEVYTALAQGTVDGMVTNMPLFYSNGFYDQLKSIMSTHCGESYHFYIINEDFYNSLPTDLQEIVDENVTKLITNTRDLEEDYLTEAVSTMKDDGVTITEASDKDEETLKQISEEKVWWDESVALTSKDDVNKVLEILDRKDEMK
ncbi:MAG: TRAP transporter substrate-binding protein [Hespellia sp.]|nr:TRAP transporter substrate-binding protein [Hespellia sp.]